ncbi:uncharacterized protein LOC129744644 [Uranotaenia lowii]|uniref:uncharacterized protein LOC129744644 n=1 Tax=Uranotaenia lowii TaxID=190385 RepID=UPI00247B1A53|nr:uncharacterized protein LOC129744644 [Uranotaenia lowii]XP_055593247.1 uncharacterized protein LOC129744644 [Uranotaenia lowii]
MDSNCCRYHHHHHHHERYVCLTCEDDQEFQCEHRDHPKQQMITNKQLMDRYGGSVNEPDLLLEVGVFSCPYCDRQRLSVSDLYDHVTLEHLDIPFCVRCPVCVCFLEDYSFHDGIHLSKHLVQGHSISFDEYQDRILMCECFSEDDFEMLKFIATTLPPSYHSSSDDSATGGSVNNSNDCSPSSSSTSSRESSSSETSRLGQSCSICFDLIFDKDNTTWVLPCKHKFHPECIDRWVQQNNSCPICRKMINI